jgi:hypothetical protein
MLIGVFTTEREIVSLADPARLSAVRVNKPVESEATDGVPVIWHFPEEYDKLSPFGREGDTVHEVGAPPVSVLESIDTLVPSATT